MTFLFSFDVLESCLKHDKNLTQKNSLKIRVVVIQK